MQLKIHFIRDTLYIVSVVMLNT